MPASSPPPRLVVVGASVGGLAACEELRRAGWDGELVLVGAEPHIPYDRPPLSKQLLAGTMEREDLALRPPAVIDALELDLRLSTTATGFDAASRTMTLDDGSPLTGDGVVLATGSRPVRLPEQPLAPPFFELRTVDDALGLRAALTAARRLVVVGGGFIGLEVAAVARAARCAVTVLEAATHPLARVFGPDVGGFFGELHRANGVDLRCGVNVTGLGTDAAGAARVALAGGEVLEADVVLIGIGAVPATEWLDGSGLDLDGGVCCDRFLRAAPGVYGIGDIARWDHPLFGPIRVEHWTTARDHARTAARNLLAELCDEGERTPAAEVPYFWSDQHGVKIQMAGWPGGADTELIIDKGDRERLVRLGREGRLVASLTWNSPRQCALERQAIAGSAALKAS